MSIKCLVLDHDDTVVRSTETVHFPCFVEYLRIYHPALADRYTLESYFEKNFDPGVVELFRDEIGMSEEEFAFEQEYWAKYVEGHTPAPFAGIREMLHAVRRAGIYIAVDSHSYERYILRDYRAGELPLPDRIYGWDVPAAIRKPAPDTVLALMHDLSLSPDEVLVVDDLKPGYDMARAAGVKFAAAAWCHKVPKIMEFMKQNADYVCETPADLCAVLLGQSEKRSEK